MKESFTSHYHGGDMCSLKSYLSWNIIKSIVSMTSGPALPSLCLDWAVHWLMQAQPQDSELPAQPTDKDVSYNLQNSKRYC
jgi:hypothetical protein